MIKARILFLYRATCAKLNTFRHKALNIRPPQLPSIKLNLPSFSNIEWPKMPSPRLPGIKLPRITPPRLRLPKIKVPSIHLPKIAVPNVRLPKPVLPRIQMPRLPRVSLPALRMPRLKLPSIKSSDILLENLAIAIVMISCIGLLAAGLGYNPTNAREDFSKFLPSNETFLLTSTAEVAIEPPPLEKTEEENKHRYKIEERQLDVEAVLVPRQVTVISSSRDGRIADIPVKNGDTFNKGDILLRYDCRDLEAEAKIAATEKELTDKKVEGSYKLFNLDLISEIDRDSLVNESEKAAAREKLYKARLEHCVIRADFDGRVTNRLANPGEFTRTDRVLIEVASREPLQAEFLIPSKWLRWINTGAPLNITIGETENSYDAEITRIYGEVDPVSQSIQIVAKLRDYQDLLLPGMSGQATLDVEQIRDAGIIGFLEQKTAHAD